MLDYVTNKIKKVYKEEFQNQNRNRMSSVEGGGGTRQVASNSDGFTLTEEESKVMNNFVRQGIMTREDYIKEVKAMKGIK